MRVVRLVGLLWVEHTAAAAREIVVVVVAEVVDCHPDCYSRVVGYTYCTTLLVLRTKTTRNVLIFLVYWSEVLDSSYCISSAQRRFRSLHSNFENPIQNGNQKWNQQLIFSIQ